MGLGDCVGFTLVELRRHFTSLNPVFCACLVDSTSADQVFGKSKAVLHWGYWVGWLPLRQNKNTRSSLGAGRAKS